MIIQFSKGRTRSAHGYKIWTPYARTNIYQFSFWLRYINKWNDLPENFVHCNSVSKFKKGLKKLFIQRDSVIFLSIHFSLLFVNILHFFHVYSSNIFNDRIMYLYFIVSQYFYILLIC